MANTRASRIPEWTIKPMQRGLMRLCDYCFRGNTRCQDSLRLHRGWHRHDSWKNHRGKQWRPVDCSDTGAAQ
jgi:hypothetical protein